MLQVLRLYSAKHLKKFLLFCCLLAVFLYYASCLLYGRYGIVRRDEMRVQVQYLQNLHDGRHLAMKKLQARVELMRPESQKISLDILQQQAHNLGFVATDEVVILDRIIK